MRGVHSVGRFLFTATLCLSLPSVGWGQIQWDISYSDGLIRSGGVGFADNTTAGSSTFGQLRRDSVSAATNYLNTILDGRGTVRLNFNTSGTDGSGSLASFGAQGIAVIGGTFQNGAVYQRARTNDSFTFPNPGPPLSTDGAGQVDFGYNWHYKVAGTTTTLSNSSFDLVSVLTHEIGHALGYSALSDNSLGALVGSGPGTYSTFDKFLQQGNTAGAGRLFNTNITQSNYGSYAGANETAYTGGNSQSTTFNGTTYTTNVTNNTTTGMYFGGKYASEVFNGLIPLYAPTTFQPGSSISHVNVGTTGGNGSGPVGLMNFAVTPNTERRFQAYEIAILMDLGWNVYNWNGTSGNWKDGVTTNAGVDTFNLANSRWRTDSGIVLAANGSTRYNTNSNQAEAPILPVSGQTTANIALNFGGTANYTTTNDVGTVRLSRLNFTNTGTTTIAGQSLNFGLNADGTASVLVPKIVQNGTGAVVISANIQLNTIATQTVLGTTFVGHNGITVDGTSNGAVTLSGTVSGNGGLTKAGTFALTLTGANTYTGGTTVTAGTLLVNGQSAGQSGTGSGAVTVTGGTLGGTGRIGGATTVTSGTLAPGDGGAGILTIDNNLSFASSGSRTLALELNGATAGSGYDRLVVNGTVALNGATLLATRSGYTPGATDILFILVNDGTEAITGTFNGLADGATFNLGGVTAYIYYGGDFASSSLTGGNDIVLTFSPVPEPATVLTIGAAGLGAISWLRRRKRGAAEPATAA